LLFILASSVKAQDDVPELRGELISGKFVSKKENCILKKVAENHRRM